MFFFRARAGKGIARHIDESSVVWTLIYRGKLANQIARLAAIVVKNNSFAHYLYLRFYFNLFVSRYLYVFVCTIQSVRNIYFTI